MEWTRDHPLLAMCLITGLGLIGTLAVWGVIVYREVNDTSRCEEYPGLTAVDISGGIGEAAECSYENERGVAVSPSEFAGLSRVEWTPLKPILAVGLAVSTVIGLGVVATARVWVDRPPSVT